MAKKFKFSLETVLRVRRAREDKAQLDYSAQLAKRVKALHELGRLERGREAAVAEQAAGRGSKMLAGDVAEFEARRRAFGDKIAWQMERLREVEAELELKRLELVAATRDRKVLEKLEEGQYSAYLEKVNREEQGFLDELARYSGPQSVNALSDNPAA